MRTSRARFFVSTTVTVFLLAVTTTNAGKIYWSEITNTTAVLQRADLDGSNVEDIAEGPTNGIAVDPDAGKLYWGFTGFPDPNTLRRANLDGSGEEILHHLSFIPGPIAVDGTTGWVFTLAGLGKGCAGIWRFRTDGTGDGEQVVPNVCAYGMAVDPGAGKLYWTDSVFEGAIRRADLDGANAETLIQVAGTPWGLALDPVGGHVYWTEQDSPNVVLRASVSGGAVEVLIAGSGDSHAVALDLEAGRLYYTFDSISNEIYRAGLDGSNPELLLDVDARQQIAIDSLGEGTEVPAVSPRGALLLILVMLGVWARLRTS